MVEYPTPALPLQGYPPNKFNLLANVRHEVPGLKTRVIVLVKASPSGVGVWLPFDATKSGRASSGLLCLKPVVVCEAPSSDFVVVSLSMTPLLHGGKINSSSWISGPIGFFYLVFVFPELSFLLPLSESECLKNPVHFSGLFNSVGSASLPLHCIT